MRRLLSLAQQEKPALILTILAGFGGGILMIWQAWLLSQVISKVFLGGATLQDVTDAFFILVSLVVFQAVLTWISEVSAKAAAVGVKRTLRKRLYNHLIRLGPAYTRGERSGALTTTVMEGVEALDAYYSQYLPQLVLAALIPVGILFFVFPLDSLSGLIFALTAPLIPVFMILIGKTAERLTKRQYETLSRLSAHFLDSLQGLRTLKLFGRSKTHSKTIDQVSRQFRDRTLSVLQVTFLSALVLEMLSTLSTAIIAVQIGLRLLYFQITFEETLFILILAPSFYLPLRLLGLRFHAGMAGTAAAREIFAILNTQAQNGQTAENTIRDTTETHPSPIIQLENVSYTYPGEVAPALKELSLAIYPGDFIALVGPSGSGKSTFVQLILGFIQPDEGVLRVNGQPIQEIDLKAWRQAIAWVPQNPYLFHDTLAANLRLGLSDGSKSAMEAVAQAAHLHAFISELPEGYQTNIMESGARLSSGQAQRLALGRAFMKNAPLLILDEPTSSLDPVMESQLEETIQRLIRRDHNKEDFEGIDLADQNRTIITIAHRLNTVLQADRIYVLREGRLCESGAHHELVNQGGIYAEMISPQTRFSGLKDWDMSSAYQEAPPPEPRSLPTGWFNGFKNHQEQSIAPLEIKNGNYQTIPTIRKLLGFLGGTWHQIAASTLLGTATIASSIGLMGTSAWLISTAALHPSIAVLQVAVVGVRAFGIGRGIFRYLERLATHEVTFRLLAHMRRWFFDALEPLAPARLMAFRSGELLSRAVSDIETLEFFYVRVVSPPLVALLVSAGTLFFFWRYDPNLVWSLVVPLLLVGIWLPARTAANSRDLGTQLVQIRATLRTKILDGIQGLPELIAYNRAGNWGEEMDAIGADLGRVQKQLASRSGLNNGLTFFIGNLGALSVLATAIPLVVTGTLEGVMLAVFVLVALAYFEALTPLPQAAEVLGSSLEAAQGLFAVVDVAPAVEDPPDPLPPPQPGPGLSIHNLTFRYQTDLPPALEDISLALESGKKIAFVGPSGAGKSTLVHLLLRFWDYDSGSILLDGRELRQYHQEDVRACFATVPPDPYFFNTSVEENLRLAQPKATINQIKAAAEAAQIHPYLQTLPQGYQTVLGERGTRLSSGQRQRLSIARALLKASPILITDEPTANLDPVTEREVLETLIHLSSNRTLLHITHRLVCLEPFDEIIVLNHGRIVERGRHEELLGKGGLYWRMWHIQGRGEKMG